MKFLNFSLIKLCLVLIAGVIAGFYFKIPEQWLFVAFSLAFLLFLFAFFRARRQLFQDVFFGISTYLVIFILGITTAYLHQPANQPGHYIHKIQQQKISSNSLIKVRLREKLKPGLFAEKYIVEAKSLTENIPGKEDVTHSIHGKILMNIARDSLGLPLKVGDELMVPFRSSNINTPLNPHQFDYRNYMEKQGVLKQLNLLSAEVLVLKELKPGILSMAASFRNHIVHQLENYSFAPEEMAIIQALLLGQRQDISAETYEKYAAAGAIHILAVSGLHVGIILFLLSWLLKPLTHFKGGKILTTILLLIIMWGFAIIAGLSPSVVRAVSMFSFVAVGMQLQRKTSVVNSLFISLFLLLLINPYFIFQVGFQLSYLAVFSIVGIQPFLYRLYEPRYKLLKYLWGILSVSIAAQVGVLPLSLFYFSQFPGLFFVSNLVILPFLGLILGMGIMMMLLASFNLLPQVLAEFYSGAIASLNTFVEWIAKQESFVFTNVNLPLTLSIAAYALIIILIILIHQPKTKNLILLLIAVIGFQLTSIYEKSKHLDAEAIIFHKSRNTLLGFKDTRKLKLYHNLQNTPRAETSIQNYTTANTIKEIKTDSLRNIFDFNGEKLLLLDSAGIYELQGLEPDLVLLINSPEINLQRLLKSTKPKKIIADGSNYTSYVERWRATCEKQKIPFHHTGKEGAFILSKEF